jgi:BirA family biotin operon repressor/biotin-[acetyl-CoA-carboxylase] ligase
LLLSALVYPPPELRRPVVLTAWAAVAVTDAVRELTEVDARIKWPNDLLVDGKKVCGILIEQGHGTVVGVGLNLNQTAAEFAADGLTEANSLLIVGGRGVEPEAALRTVVRHLDIGYARIAANNLHLLEAAWQSRVGLNPGREVVVELSDGTTATGRLQELGFDGVAVNDDTTGVRLYKPETVRRVSAVS